MAIPGFAGYGYGRGAMAAQHQQFYGNIVGFESPADYLGISKGTINQATSIRPFTAGHETGPVASAGRAGPGSPPVAWASPVGHQRGVQTPNPLRWGPTPNASVTSAQRGSGGQMQHLVQAGEEVLGAMAVARSKRFQEAVGGHHVPEHPLDSPQMAGVQPTEGADRPLQPGTGPYPLMSSEDQPVVGAPMPSTRSRKRSFNPDQGSLF
jgi:hypothetical protein